MLAAIKGSDSLKLLNDGTRIWPDLTEEAGSLRAGGAISPPEPQRLWRRGWREAVLRSDQTRPGEKSIRPFPR